MVYINPHATHGVWIVLKKEDGPLRLISAGPQNDLCFHMNHIEDPRSTTKKMNERIM